MDYNEPISVPFAVSSNGYDFSDDIQYTYKIPPVILEISPRNAPVGEFIELTITGEHLSGDISTLPLCRLESFGNGSAKLLDETTMFCETYEDITRTVVEVGLNGHDYVQNSSIAFQCTAALEVSSITPELGAVDGGTKITVTGANFEEQDSTLGCSFGPEVVPAEWISSSLLTYVSPAATIRATAVPVSVTNQWVSLCGDICIVRLPRKTKLLFATPTFFSLLGEVKSHRVGHPSWIQ